MQKLEKTYKIESTVIPLTKFYPIDYQTVKDTSTGNIYMLGGHASKVYTKQIGLNYKHFSKSLYEIDYDMWSALVAKKMAESGVQANLKENMAISIGDNIVAVLGPDNAASYSKFFEVINNYINDSNLSVYYSLYGFDHLAIIAVDSKGQGVLIQFYLQIGWINVKNVYYNPTDTNFPLVIIPHKEVDSAIDDVSLEALDKDLRIKSSHAVLEYYLANYKTRFHETKLSVHEFISLMKDIFKLKLKLEEPEIKIHLANKGFNISENSADFLEEIIHNFYFNQDNVAPIYSKFLKKAVTISDISYRDIINLFSEFVIKDEMNFDINTLADIQESVISSNTHFGQLNNII